MSKKPKGRPTIAPEDQLSRQEQLALRDKTVEKVEEMLAIGPKTSGEMALQISIPRATLNGHLRYMQQTLRIIRPTGEKKGCSTLWVLGEDPEFGSRRPANVKPYRDPLVAALFGPANHQEHKEAA